MKAELARLVDRFFSRIDYNSPPISTSTFDEFITATRRNGNKNIRAFLQVRQDERGLYFPYTFFDSWTGDQADKVVYDERYQEHFTGDELHTARLRLALTLAERVRLVRQATGRRVRATFSVVSLDSTFPERHPIDDGLLEDFVEEARALGLSPSLISILG